MKNQDLRSASSARALASVCLILASALAANAQSSNVTYTYDALGRLTEANYSNGSSIIYSYDAAGNRISVETTQPNQAPTAVDDAYNQQPGTNQLHSVLSNDTDPENDTLSLVSETGSFASISGTQIQVDAPAPAGIYSFDYIASDGINDSAPATVTITVPNAAPIAANNVYTQAAGTTADHDVLVDDTDPNGDSLTLTAEDKSYSSIVSNALRVTAPTAFGAHVITYTVSDGNGGTDTATATINVGNDNPIAVNDSYIQTHGTTVDHNVLTNDSNPNGDSLTLSSENQSYASIVGNQLRVTAPNPSGSYVVNYTVSDGNGGSANANATISVPNVAPNTTSDTYTQTHGTTVDHNVLSNDTDANGDNLTLTSENQSYSSIVGNMLRVTAPVASGSYVVTYSISDGNSGTGSATATINVPNAAPNAINDSYTQTHGTTVNHNVLANDSDPNGHSLTLAGENQSYASISSNQLRVTAPNASGNYAITYTVSDGNGGTDTAVATVAVPNVAPNAVNNTYSQSAGSTLDHDVLVNDSDPNGDTLTLSGENQSYSSIVNNKLRVVAPGSTGTYVVTYTVSDGKGGTDTATATLNVTVANTPPVANNDSYTVPRFDSQSLNVLANDSDANGDPLTITSTTLGTIQNKQILFPATSTTGYHTFSYNISDGNGGSSGAWVTVYVENIGGGFGF